MFSDLVTENNENCSNYAILKYRQIGFSPRPFLIHAISTNKTLFFQNTSQIAKSTLLPKPIHKLTECSYSVKALRQPVAKNTETVRRKIGLFYLKSLPVIHLRDMTVPPPPPPRPSPPFRVFYLRFFEHGLELLTTVIRGEGG